MTKSTRELEEAVARDFPLHLLEPWRAKAAHLEGWTAGMMPFVPDWNRQLFTLRRDDKCGDVNVATTLTSTDQDAMIAIALDFHPPR